MNRVSMSGPRVSILMPIYNAERYLRESTESMLRQTFGDFEFLVVNDGSTDGSEQTVKKYAAGDNRIRLISNKRQKGIVGALNTGLDEARGDYIVRMDGDDVSLPNRIEKQVQFMDRHPNVGVSGTWMRTLGEGKSRIWFPYPVDHEHIRIAFLFYTPVAHPTVIARRALFEQQRLRYEEAFKYAEDYELWERCVNLFEFANIPEVLLLYRVHPASVGNTHSKEQAIRTFEVVARQLKRLGITATKDEQDIHGALLFGPYHGPGFAEAAEAWLARLIEANRSKGLYDVGFFESEMHHLQLNIRLSIDKDRQILELRRQLSEKEKLIQGSGDSWIGSIAEPLRFLKRALDGKKKCRRNSRPEK